MVPYIVYHCFLSPLEMEKRLWLLDAISKPYSFSIKVMLLKIRIMDGLP